MDLLTIALIALAVWTAIAITLALALARAAGHADDATERLMASGQITSVPSASPSPSRSRSVEELAPPQLAPARRTRRAWPHPRVPTIRNLLH